MTTRGIQSLRDRDVEHEVLTYRYVRMGARIAADAIGLPHEVVLKSLVFRAEDDAFLFVLVSGNANVSTRKVGRVTGHKHVVAAAPRDAERVTGYSVGGISPLGARRRLPVILDEETARNPYLVVNAGSRGTLVRLATADLIGLTGATLADIRTS
ncbi:MAG: YbaK/EbsC family protein [Candidatus Bipolaricaulia bacterium]